MQMRLWSRLFFVFVVCVILRRTRGQVTGQLPPQTDTGHSRRWNGGNRKACYGTENGLSQVMYTDGQVKRLRDIYSNCTVVHGNLEIVDVSWNELGKAGVKDIDFFDKIEEVIGYVLIARNNIQHISFPRLKIIWGDNTFAPQLDRVVTGNLGNFSLFAMANSLEYLDMRSLRAVVEGQVGVVGNKHMCHWRKNAIDWAQILGPDYLSQNRYISDGDTADECTSASGSCSEECKDGHCWADGGDYCQEIYRKNCAPQCGNGMCFNTSDPMSCCSLQCAAGCFGPTNRDCYGCRVMLDDGVCVDRCPAREVYNVKTAQYELNPNGKFAWNRECVKNCPDHMFVYKDGCVTRCPEGYFVEDNDTVCQRCNGPCPKTCVIEKHLHSLNLHEFVNCTVIDGPLEISSQSIDGGADFIADKPVRYRGLNLSELEILESVERVTHYVFIQAPRITSLKFLRNLKRIDGRRLWNEQFALEVTSSEALKELGLSSLKEIPDGNVVISGNQQLCLADDVDWKRIAPASTPKIRNNRAADQCKADGYTCDDLCDQSECWGVGADMCLECKYYQYNRTCTKDCLPSANLYAVGKVCSACHEECNGCNGPGPQQCFTCKHAQLNGACVEQCPDSHYESSDKGCLPCHPDCLSYGCTGPGNFVGPGGCKHCLLGIVEQDRVIKCFPVLKECKLYDNLTSYYLTSSRPHLRLHVDWACLKCNDLCESCTADGVEESNCQCKKYRNIDYYGTKTCVAKCPPNTFEKMTVEGAGNPIDCNPCHKECTACYGEASTQCKACKSYKDYLNANRTRFTCTNRCPNDRQHSINGTCTSEDPASTLNQNQRTREIVLGSSVAGVLLLLLVGSVFCYMKWRRWKTSAYLQPEDEIIDINPDAKPNLARLRLILESELRRGGLLGSGAFGAVYKGVWCPNGTKVKYPVAIKVVHEATATAEKEMLSEAGIMASMDHMYLLPLNGVYVGRQLMLITPLVPLGNLLDYVQSNKAKIGSAALLRWCMQIASGMAYLEERRLVHRDLAARNVLVQTPYRIRITDFGLAKMLDYGEYELKIPDGKMPIKWLALECIQFKRYTHKSDVWAYGVTVWELLTFGEKPYRDVPLQQISSLLEKGERLQQPKVCSLDVYIVLIKCWMVDADTRPSFKELEETFRQMMKDPGRYLAIQGDALLRLPKYTVDDQKQMLEQLVDDPDVQVTDDLLNTANFSPATPISPMSPTIPFLGNGFGVESSTPHFREVSGRASPGQRQQSTSSRRYASDPLNKAGKNEDTPSTTSLRTDGDNYLLPDSVFDPKFAYTQLVDSGVNGINGADYYHHLQATISGTVGDDSATKMNSPAFTCLDNQVYIMQTQHDDSHNRQPANGDLYQDSDVQQEFERPAKLTTENESVV